mgnify:CR=1 FL=1
MRDDFAHFRHFLRDFLPQFAFLFVFRIKLLVSETAYKHLSLAETGER